MILKIRLEDFLSQNEITFHDPMNDSYFGDYDYSAKYLSNINGIDYTEEQIEASPTLKDKLNTCVSRAEESAQVDAYYTAQCNAIENYAVSIVEWLNEQRPLLKMKLSDYEAPDYSGAGGSFTIETKNARVLADITREIIEGQGYFDYSGNTNEFIRSIDSTNSPVKAVTQHTHYWMNGHLISDIYGDPSRYEVSGYDVDRANEGINKDYLKELISEEIVGDTDIEDELAALKFTTINN